MTIWQRTAWWQDAGALRRLVADLAGAELARLRPAERSIAWPAAAGLPAMTAAELAALAAALAAFFCLEDAAAIDAALRQADWLAALQTALPAADGDLAFLTSGSSGIPKPVRQAYARLDEEAAFQLDLQGHAPRIVSLVPAHHIYGFLFTVLLPYRWAAPVLDLRDRRPAAVLAALQPGDLVIGFPEVWKALAQTALQAGRPPPAGIRGITSTAPCPPEVARAVRAAGFARLVELYGSSETMGIGWRDDPDRPYALFPYWRLGEDAATLHHRTRGFATALPDHVETVAADGRHFIVRGRRDGAIQIGGINVHPAHVVAVLREHPAIKDAAVRPYRAGPTLRLKAFIVPADPQADTATLRREIETWLRGRLPAIERPRSLTFGPVLPQGAMGKAADWAIAGRDGD
jgi:4-coumarate--CoA ligase